MFGCLVMNRSTICLVKFWWKTGPQNVKESVTGPAEPEGEPLEPPQALSSPSVESPAADASRLRRVMGDIVTPLRGFLWVGVQPTAAFSIGPSAEVKAVSYTHLRAHETDSYL